MRPGLMVSGCMQVYRYLNALSLDVVAGALVGTLFFAKLLKVRLPWTVLFTLGLAVWAIYTIDHLWDASRSQFPALTFRHRLHHQYQKLLKILAILVLFSGAVIFWYLPQNTREMGMLLMLIVGVYFLSIRLWTHHPLYHKEILVAIVYCCGILLGPFSLQSANFETPHCLILLQFASLAFSNLMVFAYFDVATDRQQGFRSLCSEIGKKKSRVLIFITLALVVVSAITGQFIWTDQTGIPESQWIIILMTIPLAIILMRPEYFSSGDKYRMLGDATFFIPLLVL